MNRPSGGIPGFAVPVGWLAKRIGRVGEATGEPAR